MDTAVQRNKTRDLVYVAVFAALMAICSWISIPTDPPFTLQTMGVFLSVGLLGGKRGSMAVGLHMLLGAIGLPVFAHFTGGLGTLLGTTGGYILGFLLSAMTMWAMERLFGTKPLVLFISMVLGLFVCYAFGTAWYMVVYAQAKGPISLAVALGWCVIPFLIPDFCKIAVAMALTARLRPHVR